MAQNWRLTHHKDPVPHVPFEEWDFHHQPTEVFYDEASDGYTLCDSSGEDPLCSDQYWFDLLWTIDHLNYVGFDYITNYLGCKLT